MSARAYLCDVIGDGGSPATAFRPALADLVPDARYAACDARHAGTGAGRMLVIAGVTPEEHARLITDARVTYLPIEDEAGRLLDLETATIGHVAAGNRAILRDALEAWLVAVDDLPATTTIRDVFRRVKRHYLVRQRLTADDYREDVGTLSSAELAKRRNDLCTRLAAEGFDVTGIGQQDTLRSALRKIVTQEKAPLFRETRRA